MYNLPIPCVILARKNSKGLKDKNIYKLDNLSLVEHSIIYAKKSTLVSDIIVSTDDIRIKRISEKYKCFTIFPRPKKFSQDFSKSEPAIKHALENFIKTKGKIDIYAYLQVTEPIRPKNILDKCIKNLIKNKSLESSFAGYVMHKNFWIKKQKKYLKLNKSKVNFLPRQNRQKIYREDTGISLASRYSLIKKGIRVGKKIKIEEYQGIAGLVDIHSKQDILIANSFLKI